ncbi:MAG: 50S ribosomal protein L6 [Tissierellia bacterium]|nr:50S ribosomal protein L6 [Tissierellia bacterium]
MSRIGLKPIDIPNGVEVKLGEGNSIEVKGPKGVLSDKLSPEMEIKIEDNQIFVNRPSDDKKHKSLHGLTRTLIANMVEGVTNGYSKKLEIHGTGYRAQKQGKKLILNLGFSHPVELEDPEGIEVEVPSPNQIIVKGIDKQKVGNYAAVIRAYRKPEPYKGKGIRYADEYVRRKVGKTG